MQSGSETAELQATEPALPYLIGFYFHSCHSLNDNFSAYKDGCLRVHLCTFITTIQIHITCNTSKGVLIEYSYLRFCSL